MSGSCFHEGCVGFSSARGLALAMAFSLHLKVDGRVPVGVEFGVGLRPPGPCGGVSPEAQVVAGGDETLEERQVAFFDRLYPNWRNASEIAVDRLCIRAGGLSSYPSLSLQT